MPSKISPSPTLPPRWKEQASVILLLLATFALRLYALDARPLWWDEGLTLTYAYLPPLANLKLALATEHLNPPAYNWLVGGLTYLSGVTLFTARLVSVYGGLLTAVLAYTLSRLAFGRTVGMLTLLLTAVAPMQIYHAQEAKGYTIETAVLLAAVYCWLRVHPWAVSLNRNRGAASWPWWLGYAAATLLAMGTNYLAIFGLLVFNILTLIVSVQAARRGLEWSVLGRHWLYWLAAQAMSGLPLLPYVWASFSSAAQGLENTSIGLVTLSLPEYAWLFLNTFIVSERPGGGVGQAVTILILLLAGGSLWASIPQEWRAGRRFAALWLIAPLAVGYLFHLRFAWFFPRYLLYAQPALLALAAVGLARLAASRLRPLAPPLLTAILLFFLPILQLHYAAPPSAAEDDDWPLLFETIQPYLDEGDGVIARASWMPGYMAAYLPPEPEMDWILGYFDEATMDETLAEFVDARDRIWQIDYQLSPLSDLNDSAVWMRGNAALSYFAEIGVATAVLFVQPEDRRANRQTDHFANGVSLTWAATTTVVEPGDVVSFNLIWEAARPLDSHLVRFLHVMDSDEKLIAQIDREPVIGSSRSYEWEVGEPIYDPAAVALPPTLPPGFYTIRLGLYDRLTLERVNLLSGGDYLLAGVVEVRE